MEAGPWFDVVQGMLWGLGLNMFVYCLGFTAGQFGQWAREIEKA